MESYSVDIDPGQVVRWVKEECEAAPTTFRINARQAAEVREIPARQDAHLGDEELEDLSEIATVATLEIGPRHASDGWLLSVIVEDEGGPRMSETRADRGEEEIEERQTEERQIDLGTFYHAFIRSGRGTANVVAEVDGPTGRGHLDRLLHAIEQNRHYPDRSAARR